VSTPKQIKELFNATLKCEPNQRRTFLAHACADDTTLRREVESLLFPTGEVPHFLESPVFEISAIDLAAQILGEEEEHSLVGQRIGSYCVDREIGHGGMGAVYLATRVDGHYDQQVALKLIKRGMDSEEVLRRFRRERQILADLSHPYISRLLDGGTTVDGRPFFVMEYVDGQPITQYVNTQQLSTNQRLQTMLAVFVAVEYAHQHNVVHRDLKPGNILITADGTPRLLDFGIAKLLDSSQSAQSTGEISAALHLFTPEYASPEQLRGLPLTPASDVYSLGVVLYELLTGYRPYDSKSRAPQEILRLLMVRDPDKPSIAVSRTASASNRRETLTGNLITEAKPSARQETVGKLRRELRGDIDRIVLTALRKEPEHRYSSVADFAADIRRHLEGVPIKARKETLSYRSAKFLKRHRGAVFPTLIAASLCLLIGVLIGPIFRQRPETTQSIAVLPFINTGNDPNIEHLADGLTDALIESLSREPKLIVPAHESVFSFKRRGLASGAAGKALKVENVLQGTMRVAGEQLFVNLSLINTGSGQTIWNREYNGNLSNLLSLEDQISRDVVQKLGGGQIENGHALNRHTDNVEAYRQYLMGRYFWNKQTKESFEKGIEYFRNAIEKDPNYAMAYSGLADCYGLLGAYMVQKPEEAFPASQRAARMAIRLDESVAEAHTSLALGLWLYDWDWVAADAEFKRAIELNPHYVTAHHWRGLFLGEMGRFDEAIAEMKQAQAADPISAPLWADLGRVYYWARRYDKALEAYHQAREIDASFGALGVESLELYQVVANHEDYALYAKLGWHMGEDRSVYLSRSTVDYLRRRLPSRRRYDRVTCYARLGEKDKAFLSFEEAIRARDHRMTQIKVDPYLDNLRSDPRFADLLRRMKLAS
jgi:serine/threonine protein kinase/tetratricopeptide (TPR) repeat protein